jgi:hypothetical protein
MSGGTNQTASNLSIWDIDNSYVSTSERWLRQVQDLWSPYGRQIRKGHAHVLSVCRQTHLMAAAVRPKLEAEWQRLRSVLLSQAHRLIPSLVEAEAATASHEPDMVQEILGEFEALRSDMQDKVARNLALLWDNFQDAFGGISGFMAAQALEQDAFMHKLNAAAERMRPARGTSAAFHYVTVELMRQYVTFFRSGRSDPKAVRLATCVVSLIEHGRGMPKEPIAYSVKS